MANILLIDDEALVLETFYEALRVRGHEVHTAPSGADAVTFVTQCDFDLVICDMFMPDHDGFDVICQIKTAKPTQKVIVSTGGGVFGNLDVLNMASRFGADDTYCKADGLEILYATVDRVLAESVEGFEAA